METPVVKDIEEIVFERNGESDGKEGIRGGR
jgi:hypothetical protein